MQNIDQQFVEYIAKTLSAKPEAVNIERTVDERGVLLKLSVDPEDLGRIIGKGGQTAQAIRTLLRALGIKDNAHYNLKIVDTDGGEGAKKSESLGSAPEASPAPALAPVENATDAPVEKPAEEPNASENLRKGLDTLDDLDI